MELLEFYEPLSWRCFLTNRVGRPSGGLMTIVFLITAGRPIEKIRLLLSISSLPVQPVFFSHYPFLNN
jgi:hypothetical protein